MAWPYDSTSFRDRANLMREAKKAGEAYEKQEPVDIYCDIIRETEKAVLVKYGDDEHWLPKSQVEIHKTETVTRIVVPAWLAEKKGLVS